MSIQKNREYQREYYYRHKDERLLYQRTNESYKEYQKVYQVKYYEKKKEHLKELYNIRYAKRKIQKQVENNMISIVKPKPLPQYKKDILERMLRRHLIEIEKRCSNMKHDVNIVANTVGQPVAQVIEEPEEMFVGFYTTPTGYALSWD
jgi:hypothetical protein